MISTALAIQDATKEAVFNDSTMEIAKNLLEARNMVSEDAFMKMLYLYSAHLSAVTATLVTSVCLTESQLDEMMDTIKEMENMGKEEENGN